MQRRYLVTAVIIYNNHCFFRGRCLVTGQHVKILIAFTANVYTLLFSLLNNNVDLCQYNNNNSIQFNQFITVQT
jgi:hypothetical protein